MNRREGIIVCLLILVAIVFFEFRSLGLSVVQTPSSVSVLGENTAPVIGFVNSTIYVCERDILFYLFNATDSDGDSLTPSITPQDPFFVFWFSQTPPNTHNFAIVSGTLDKNDLGGVNSGSKTYAETIYIADDSSNDSAQTNITVIEINNAPNVENIGVQTVWTEGENSTFSETFDVSDLEKTLGYGNFIFSVTITNSTGHSVELFDISAEGVMSYEGNSDDVGVYNVTVCVTDTGLSVPHPLILSQCNQTGGAITSCDNFTLTIVTENRAPNITAYYPTNLTPSVSETTSAYFNITKYDPDGTIPDTYWFVDGVLWELDDAGFSTDEFTYSFGCGNSGNATIKAEITDGEFNDSVEWNLTYIASSCPVAGGGGGGGGGGGAAFSNFELQPEFITTTIFQKEGQSFEVKVKNTGATILNLDLNVENITDITILSDENLSLNVGEEKTFKIYIYALSETVPGVYFGKILVSAGSLSKTVSIVAEIKKKEALFDVKVVVPPEFKLINPGDTLPVDVEMLNVGLYGNAVDVELYLYITDFDKILWYETSKEIIAVETNLSVRRDLHMPLKATAGTYLVLAEMTYGNLTVSTYDTFNVAEKKYLRATFFLIILAILILIALLLFILWKRRKKKEENER